MTEAVTGLRESESQRWAVFNNVVGVIAYRCPLRSRRHDRCPLADRMVNRGFQAGVGNAERCVASARPVTKD